MLVKASILMANIAAAVPMTAETRRIVEVAINAGATVTAIAALLGGTGLVFFIVRQAFKKGTTKVILAA